VGRSDEERRQALRELQRLWEAGAARAHLTTEQLRRARALMEERFAIAENRRRAEDRIRDEYHDSKAVIVTGHENVGSPAASSATIRPRSDDRTHWRAAC
jgi:hypothetical protein